MTPASPDNGSRLGRELTAGWSRRKLVSFGLFFVALSSALALYAAEYFLQSLSDRISHSESMQPGLIRYDAVLGWANSPGWSGNHQHHDFDVPYSIDKRAFRFDPAMERGSPRVAVLGDSFTFGLGVEDSETFVSRLNAETDGIGPLLNMGVPGYSTDQQLLLYQRTFGLEKAETVVLVVYLANDLFDNARPFPLQADHGKPFYSLKPDGSLMLHNSPVPKSVKPAAARGADLSSLVLGDEQPPASWLERKLGRTQIAHRLGLFQPQATLPEALLQRRLDPYLELFVALTSELQQTVSRRRARLVVALLPGASYVEQPQSLSAQYQQYLRRQLLRRLKTIPGTSVIDVAGALGEAVRERGETFYFPNEGHLNADGHRFVSRVIGRYLASDAAGD